MKKLILVFCLIVFFIFSCKSSSNIKINNGQIVSEQTFKAPNGVSESTYIHYLAYFGTDWSNYSVKSKKALAVFKKYFNGLSYRVIWNWDIDGSGIADYLAVEVQPNIRRGIKRGILVDGQGKIKMYIDTVKGVYAPDYKNGGIYIILDLKKSGIKKGELFCYSIGYISPNLIGDGDISSGISLSTHQRKRYDEIYKQRKAEIKRRRLVPLDFIYGNFLFQMIDKDFKVMSMAHKNSAYIHNHYINAIYIPSEHRSVFKLFTASFGLNQYYGMERYIKKKYREAKRLGKVFCPPKKINQEHVKVALEILLHGNVYRHN